MNTGTKIILKQVLSHYGQMIYTNPSKLKNFLSDYGVSKREINSLVSIISSHYFKTFVEMIGGPDRDYQKKRLAAEVLDEFALDENLLNDCINCIEYAIDTNVEESSENNDSSEIGFEEIKQKANDGNTDMQYKLAYMYEKELIEAEDTFGEALYWYRKSASGENIKAQLALAQIYEDNRRIPKNLIKSFFWYNKAADKNDPTGLYHVGMNYFDGLGVKKNHREAFTYFKKAAEARSYKANYMLGECYLSGIGVEQDCEEAVYQYLQAAKRGLTTAEAKLGILYFKGTAMSRDFQKSFDYFERAAEKKHALALLALGIFYMEGITTKDSEKAILYLKKARESDTTAAQLILDFGSERLKGSITTTYMFNEIDDRMSIYNTYYTD